MNSFWFATVVSALAFLFQSNVARAEFEGDPFCEDYEMAAATEFMEAIGKTKDIPKPKNLGDFVSCYPGNYDGFKYLQAIIPMNLDLKKDGSVYNVVQIFVRNPEKKYVAVSELMTAPHKYDCGSNARHSLRTKLPAPAAPRQFSRSNPCSEDLERLKTDLSEVQQMCDADKYDFLTEFTEDGTSHVMLSCLDRNLTGKRVRYAKTSYDCDAATGKYRWTNRHTWSEYVCE